MNTRWLDCLVVSLYKKEKNIEDLNQLMLKDLNQEWFSDFKGLIGLMSSDQHHRYLYHFSKSIMTDCIPVKPIWFVQTFGTVKKVSRVLGFVTNYMPKPKHTKHWIWQRSCISRLTSAGNYKLQIFVLCRYQNFCLNERTIVNFAHTYSSTPLFYSKVIFKKTLGIVIASYPCLKYISLHGATRHKLGNLAS